MDLNQKMLLRTAAPFNSGQKTVVELSGFSRAARQVLNNKPLTVLYFPFHIGRVSRSDPASSAKQDLLLPDYKPFNVSRNHLVIDKDKEKTVLIDSQSTCGTLVDDTQLGKALGGPGRMELAPGPHVVSLGGPDSPFIFRFAVRTFEPADFLVLDGSLPDRLPQARMLYEKLCSLEQDLLADALRPPRQRALDAEGMVRVILKRPDLIEMLRCLASNPVAGSDYLARHSVNVAIFSIILYTNLRFRNDDIVRIAAAALLHDIGMQGIDRRVLNKNSGLSPREYALIKSHTTAGSEQLSGPDEICSLAALLARDHHERIDRSGYPRGSALLPDVTRFFGVVDAFEALTHDRPQRAAFSPHEAVRLITASDNRAFDADTRRALLNAFSFFPVSTIVRLNNGELGQVVGVNQGRPLSPKVRIIQASAGPSGSQNRIIDLSREPTVTIVRDVPDSGLERRHINLLPDQS